MNQHLFVGTKLPSCVGTKLPSRRLPAGLQGFVAGTSAGMLAAFERDSGSKPYRLAKTYDASAHCGGTQAAEPAADAPAAGAPAAAGADAAPPRVCSLAVCPGDESVAVLTSANQLLQLAVPAGARKALFSGVAPLAPGFHSGAITGLATCVRRPVVATAGADRTLRIWNWRDATAELVGGRGLLLRGGLAEWLGVLNSSAAAAEPPQPATPGALPMPAAPPAVQGL